MKLLIGRDPNKPSSRRDEMADEYPELLGRTA
jgi:hypothetical protein